MTACPTENFMQSRFPTARWLLCFFSIVAVGFALDWFTKDYLAGTLTDEQRVAGAMIRTDVIPSWFSIVTNSELNKGALFSLGNKFGIKANTFFICISIVAITGIVGWSLWPRLKRPAIYTVTLGLILAGALGNCFDRIIYGGVRDWIWVYYQRGPNDYPFNWPIFNIADCFLVGGAILLVLHGIFWPTPATEKPLPASISPAKG